MELGWHPCLTLDRPLSSCVPSLVNAEGRFWPLGGFLRRLWLGRIRDSEIEMEFRAQYERYGDLLGRPHALVHAQHDVQVFSPFWSFMANIIRCVVDVPTEP